MKYLNIFIPLIIAVAVLGVTTYSHEQVHVLAYSYKGYHNTTMGFEVLKGRAYVMNHDEIAEEDSSDIYLANMFNEVVAYNLTVPLITLVLGMFMIIIYSPLGRK